MKSYNGCKACRNALRGKSNQKRSTPPTKSIANGNIFGQVPEDVVASSSMTEVLCSSDTGLKVGSGIDEDHEDEEEDNDQVGGPGERRQRTTM